MFGKWGFIFRHGMFEMLAGNRQHCRTGRCAIWVGDKHLEALMRGGQHLSTGMEGHKTERTSREQGMRGARGEDGARRQPRSMSFPAGAEGPIFRNVRGCWLSVG